MKRVILFVLTNIAVVLTISILVSVLTAFGILPRFDRGSLNGLLVMCFVWGMGGSLISLQLSRFLAKRALGVKLIDGRSGSATDRLYNTVQNLTQAAGLPMPEVGVYDSPEVNAFATGPSKRRALVAVSTGLLQKMRPSEVDGVLGHEIAHIKNGDMVTMALLQGVINAFVMFLAHVIASLLFRSRDDEDRGPGFMYYIALNFIQMGLSMLGMVVVCWFSRQREFRADAGGAELAGRGNMVAALRGLMTTQQLVDNSQPSLTTMKIAGGPMALLSTHPPLELRIAKLEGRA